MGESFRGLQANPPPYVLSSQFFDFCQSRTNFSDFLNCSAPSTQPLLTPLGRSHTPPALRDCQSALSPGFCQSLATFSYLATPRYSMSSWLQSCVAFGAMQAGPCLGGSLCLGLTTFLLQSCINFVQFDIKLQ